MIARYLHLVLSYLIASASISTNFFFIKKCPWSDPLTILIYLSNHGNLHSRSKCLVWVKKCCHIWLDQNFDPSLLTNKLWHVFMGKKQKKKNKNFFEKKKSKWPTQKKYCIFCLFLLLCRTASDFEKCTFFESAILNFFFQKKIFFFCFFSHEN